MRYTFVSLALSGILLVTSAYGLANGYTKPSLGANTWYMLHAHLTYPNYTWEKGYVMGEDSVKIASFMKEKSLFVPDGSLPASARPQLEVGHEEDPMSPVFFNYDDCIVQGRDASGNLIADEQAFPNGMKSVMEQINKLGFQAGAYGDRGHYTCSCWAGGLKRPGQAGHEAQDAAWVVSQGAQYYKEDSCNNGGLPDAPAEYAKMRDGFNATGKAVLFNLCWGAGETVASIGRSLGNEWRIAEDDGGGWGPILVNVDVGASLGQYSGCVADSHGAMDCGFNDPGLLLVGSPELSRAQERSHLALWLMLNSKLLISVDPRTFGPYELGLLRNKFVLAISQDDLREAGSRLLPANATAQDAERMAAAVHLGEQEGRMTPERLSRAGRLAKYEAVAVTRGMSPGEAAARQPDFEARLALERVRASAAATQRSEVWGRKLAGGAVAVALFNRQLQSNATIECSGDCWSALGFAAGDTVSVTDVFSQQQLSSVTGGVSATVAPNDTSLLWLAKTSGPASQQW